MGRTIPTILIGLAGTSPPSWSLNTPTIIPMAAMPIRVAELHDCFAHDEVISYEGLGFCGEGEAQKFIADGDNTYGGRVVTNPSGGLLSKGHPLGATGLAQCFELTHQLRGTAGERQVDGVRHGLQHNLGLGGACVVRLYERAD